MSLSYLISRLAAVLSVTAVRVSGGPAECQWPAEDRGPGHMEHDGGAPWTGTVYLQPPHFAIRCPSSLRLFPSLRPILPLIQLHASSICHGFSEFPALPETTSDTNHCPQVYRSRRDAFEGLYLSLW